MTMDEFIRRFRAEAKDERKPYLWSDELIKGFFNGAERRACVCARLLFEDDDPAICSIDLSVADHTYALHGKLYEIVSLHIANAAGEMRPIELRSREWLNANDPGWRESSCLAYAAIQRDTAIRVVGEIVAGDELLIEGYRLPMRDMAAADSCPEIHEAHHEHLIEWALHKAFSIPDTDGFDPDRAAKHEARFTRYFGPLPDSDMRRSTRTDSVQHNEVHIF
jgi:hypothetical protein